MPEFDYLLAETGSRHSFRDAALIINVFVLTNGKHNHTWVAVTPDVKLSRSRLT